MSRTERKLQKQNSSTNCNKVKYQMHIKPPLNTDIGGPEKLPEPRPGQMKGSALLSEGTFESALTAYV